MKFKGLSNKNLVKRDLDQRVQIVMIIFAQNATLDSCPYPEITKLALVLITIMKKNIYFIYIICK